jgi:hypothetical protein
VIERAVFLHQDNDVADVAHRAAVPKPSLGESTLNIGRHQGFGGCGNGNPGSALEKTAASEFLWGSREGRVRGVEWFHLDRSILSLEPAIFASEGPTALASCNPLD